MEKEYLEEMNHDERDPRKARIIFVAKAILPLICALVFVFGISKIVSDPKIYAGTIASLDEKKKTVLELTSAAAASSTAISLFPGDGATPIANKLADLSSYFLVVLCAIFLEKYLVTITGYIACKFLIPIACVLLSVNQFFKKEMLAALMKKLFVFSVVIMLVVPVSVKISNLIDSTYGSSIEETLDLAKESTEEIEENADESDEKDQGFLSGVISKVENGVTGAVDKVETVLNHFVEAIAVLIVTSCVIPILVLFLFVLLIKGVLGVDIGLTKKS